MSGLTSGGGAQVGKISMYNHVVLITILFSAQAEIVVPLVVVLLQ